MRPFFRTPASGSQSSRFFFNGHYEFHNSGASDNPKIGTLEDWYLINVMASDHPIHIHLINFQIISKTTLKTFTSTQTNKCTYYEMDFYKEAGVFS